MNPKDQYAVAVCQANSNIVVGRIPQKISKVSWLFLNKPNCTITCTVTGGRQHSNGLTQGELEIPCQMKFVGPLVYICTCTCIHITTTHPRTNIVLITCRTSQKMCALHAPVFQPTIYLYTHNNTQSYDNNTVHVVGSCYIIVKPELEHLGYQQFQLL